MSNTNTWAKWIMYLSVYHDRYIDRCIVEISIVTQSTFDRYATDMSIDCRPRVDRWSTDTDHRPPLDEKLPIHYWHFTVISPTLDWRSVVRRPIYRLAQYVVQKAGLNGSRSVFATGSLEINTGRSSANVKYWNFFEMSREVIFRGSSYHFWTVCKYVV